MGYSFNDKDLSRLEQTMILRERMMNNIASAADADLPRKPSDIMAVTTLLESIDRSILGRAKIDIEGDSAKNQDATKELLKSLILDIHTNGVGGHSNRQITNEYIQPSYTPSTELSVSEGELIYKSDNFVQED